MNECIIWPNEEKSPVRIVDADGEEIVAVMVGDTYKGYPVFRLNGEFTISQLFRITHVLGEAMVERGLSAQTAAGWARDEDLGKLVTGGADDDR